MDNKLRLKSMIQSEIQRNNDDSKGPFFVWYNWCPSSKKDMFSSIFGYFRLLIRAKLNWHYLTIYKMMNHSYLVFMQEGNWGKREDTEEKTIVKYMQNQHWHDYVNESVLNGLSHSSGIDKPKRA